MDLEGIPAFAGKKYKNLRHGVDVYKIMINDDDDDCT